MAQAPPDGIQHILWAFSHTLPESADTNVDIKAHHMSGSANLNSMHTAAEPSDDDMGGNGDGDRANSQSMPLVMCPSQSSLVLLALRLLEAVFIQGHSGQGSQTTRSY